MATKTNQELTDNDLDQVNGGWGAPIGDITTMHPVDPKEIEKKDKTNGSFF